MGRINHPLKYFQTNPNIGLGKRYERSTKLAPRP